MGTPKNWDRHKGNDPFTFIIELVREDDSVIKMVAGADNVVAAKAAYKALPYYHGPSDILRIRQGGRVMANQRGNDGERLALIESMKR